MGKGEGLIVETRVRIKVGKKRAKGGTNGEGKGWAKG